MLMVARGFLVLMILLLAACAPRAAAQTRPAVGHRQEPPTDHGVPAGLQPGGERLGPGELRPGTMTISGVERTYLLYIPTTYDPGRPAALVLMFHGGEM